MISESVLFGSQRTSRSTAQHIAIIISQAPSELVVKPISILITSINTFSDIFHTVDGNVILKILQHCTGLCL